MNRSPQSPSLFPGNGIWRPENMTPKWPSRFRQPSPETARPCETPPHRRYSPRSGKSPGSNECVVADAVAIKPVSTTEFPAIREKNREFIDSGVIFGPERSKNPLKPGLRSHIPYALEQGI